MNEIRMACRGAIALPYTELNAFQGDLKTLSLEDYEKLKREIINTGFAFAPHIWNNPKDGKWYLLDGHQRTLTVKQLVEKEGYSCPDIPCVPVEAKDEKEAKRRILQATSQYGKMEKQGLYEFMHTADIDLPDLESSFRLPEIDMFSFQADYFGDNENIEVDSELEFSKEIDEKNDYIVLLFSDKNEFEVACEKLEIKRVNISLSPSGRKSFIMQGIGRIIDGKPVIDRL